MCSDMIVYRATPSFVFITSSFPRVASVNKQVLVDSELILQLCRELIFTFAGEEILFLPAFSHALYFHYTLMRPCHLCSVDTLR